MLRRANRAADGPADDLHRYQMRQKMVAIGDDFWIENAAGERVFKVDGKAVRVRETLNFEDAQGNVLCKIQERKLRVRDSMAVDDAAGEQVAEVHKALISPIRDRFEVQLKDGPDLEVKGNIVDHEYTIGEGRDKVAQVSKKWFRIRDSYGVEIEPGQDDVVILAITVCIDQIAHSGK
jgi:uncharacterized protein YxjI